MEDLICQLLWGQLRRCGFFNTSDGDWRPGGWPVLYERWLEETITVLVGKSYLQYASHGPIIDPFAVVNGPGILTTSMDVAAFWHEWDSRKARWLADPDKKALIILLETTLRALPEILSGQRPATDVIFPNSSMELVEDIYKCNAVADSFNAILADTVVDYVRARRVGGTPAGLRIFEIGAGTGGTSAMVLEKLRENGVGSPSQPDDVLEYCYTDISKAFLMHAEREYGCHYAYLTYRLFDVEQPIAPQGLGAARYDLVIAANVLHATRNIRRTLRNAKALLKPNGLLLLNELSIKSLFTHLTFGLLEGWWRYEDVSLRLPGCPALDPAGWRWVLAEEGFRSVCFPAEQLHHLGQQIIVAESDGIVRQAPGAHQSATGLAPYSLSPQERGRVRDAGYRHLHTALSQEENVQLPPQTVVHTTRPAPLTPDRSEPRLLRDKSTAYVRALVGETLKIPATDIDPGAPLEVYGIDSILVVKLANRFREVFDNITSTLFFEYQTIDALVGHLLETRQEALVALVGAETAPTEARFHTADQRRPVDVDVSMRVVPAPTPPARADVSPSPGHDVAIIGLAGRYPGAVDVPAFWQNLKDGRSCIGEIPQERWDWRAYFDEDKGKPGFIYTKWGGFLDDIDCFDPLFFHIAPKAAAIMDPQARLFLEIVYATVEDAGYTPATLTAYGKVGVFVGVMNSTYTRYTNFYSIANLVSYHLNFQGPSMAVDSACSASLTAIHLAVESIATGTSDLAIAGGVNLIVHPIHYQGLAAATMLSSGDACRPFGAGADGFVAGEGVGAVLLKPLHKAVADHDQVYGVIKGSMINAGGKTNGYTVPNPMAQARLIADALRRAQVPARSISYLEAHGTGTALGDPIEIAGLTRAFREVDQQDATHGHDRQFCAIGSVKSNIGHGESAAGIAGLTKVLLQLKHRQLVPSLHAESPNPEIDFAHSPFVVQREPTSWERPRVGETEYPRRAGISSFGAGGANAHLVIEEYVASRPPGATGAPPPVMIVLSAKNEQRLRAMAQQLLEAIRAREHDLVDMAYTLQVGRVAMEERLAMVVTTLTELETNLGAFLGGQVGVAGLYRGQARRGDDALTAFTVDEELREAVEKWMQRGKYDRMLELWVKGLEVDWAQLYAEPHLYGRPPCRISLPTYPFARERYWAPGHDTVSPATPPSANLGLLTPQNISLTEGIPWGEPLAQLARPILTPTPTAGLLLLTPTWQPVALAAATATYPTGERVLLAGAADRDAWSRSFPNAVTLEAPLSDDIATIADKLTALGLFDHVIWVTPDHAPASPSDELLIDAREQGVLAVFRLVKALLTLNYGVRELTWTLVTRNTQPVLPPDVINPTHAALHGLVGSMAKEYPHWKVRVLDLETGVDLPIEALLSQPADPGGDARAYRDGNWYRQELVPVRQLATEHQRYRRHGVYVVIGGAGGIGEVWSRFMIETYEARIVWIGRRPKDAAIQAKLEALAALGHEPLYISADATDRAALERAYREIKQCYAHVNGLVHSAIVLDDQSLASMNEARFRAGLAAKMDVSVRMAQVFQHEALDFVLFFSSLQSFSKSPGQSNYAAGCTFKDAFAHYLARHWSCAVKVMNWGYWGGTGIVAAQDYQARMTRVGVGSIESARGNGRSCLPAQRSPGPGGFDENLRRQEH